MLLAGLAASGDWTSHQKAAQASDGRGQTHTLDVGEESALRACLHDSGGGKEINPSFIERFNATMRERLAALTRRCPPASHRLEAVEWGMYLIGCTSNLCWIHQQAGSTPAMAAGLTDYTWSVKEVLCYKVAPVPFEPPKRSRGRPRTPPQVDGPAVKAPQGRPSRYLPILRRLQQERRARLPQGQAHPPVNVAVPSPLTLSTGL
jgi:hypothetical protein